MSKHATQFNWDSFIAQALGPALNDLVALLNERFKKSHGLALFAERGGGGIFLARHLQKILLENQKNPVGHQLIVENAQLILPPQWLKFLSGKAWGLKTDDALVIKNAEVLWSKNIKPTLRRSLQKQIDNLFTAKKKTYRLFLIISQSPGDLDQALKDKRLTKSLYQKMIDQGLCLPTLDEEKHRIPLLITTMISDFGKKIDQEAMAELMNYSWPGGWEELYQCIRQALTNAQKTITLDDLPLPIAVMADTHMYPQKLPPQLR